jgi:hypothetical protein
MARKGAVIDASSEDVRKAVLEYANQQGWQLTGDDNAASLAFQWRRTGLASRRQDITVTIESVATSQTNVFVETQARARYGMKQLFDWGQGDRAATGLIDTLKSNRQPPAPA